LRFDFAVVVVQVLMRGFAERTGFMLRDWIASTKFYRLENPVMFGLVGIEQRSVI